MTNTITKERRDAVKVLIRKALQFSYWAAGEGIGPAEGQPAEAPDDFLVAYSDATGDGDWEALSDQVSALLDALDAAEARAAQADHAASCLADMVKELQAAAGATGTAPEPVAWTSADNLDLMAYRGADLPYEALMWSEPTPDHGVSLYRRPPAAAPGIPEGWVLVPVELHPYDAGLLSDWGGGNVEWWQDYLRHELNRAHEFYNSQLAADLALVSEKEAE